METCQITDLLETAALIGVIVALIIQQRQVGKQEESNLLTALTHYQNTILNLRKTAKENYDKARERKDVKKVRKTGDNLKNLVIVNYELEKQIQKIIKKEYKIDLNPENITPSENIQESIAITEEHIITAIEEIENSEQQVKAEPEDEKSED